MSSMSCARCGRQRSEPTRDSSSSVDGPGGPAGEQEPPWAEFDGHDVCPDCQTLQERHAAVTRAIEMVVREISRRQEAGEPPDQYEAALVELVMAHRADDHAPDEEPTDEQQLPEPVPDRAAATAVTAADEAADEAAREVAVEATQVVDAGPRHLRVAVTGAFLTGHPLAVRTDGYRALQRELGRHLRLPEWRVEGLSGQDGTYQSGGGFSQGVPLVIARREGADLLPRLATVLDSPSCADGTHTAAFAPVVDAVPRRLVIDVYDLGVAVMTAEFDVATATDELGDTARAVKRLVWLRPGERGRSPLADALQDIATGTAAAYGEAVLAAAPTELRAGAWLSRGTPEPANAPSSQQRADDQGRLLWLHPVHLMRTTDRPAKRLARDLVPAFHKTIDLDGGVFAAGVGSSAVVVSNSSAAEAPVRLTELHWAYYALYMEIDRGLLGVLDQQRWSQHAPLWQLEEDADDVFADYLRIMDARARLDSHLSALGGDEFAIWETIAQAQRFDAVVDAVERKLDVLGKLAERRVSQATADRARRTGDILGWLTVLSVVTLVIAVIGALVGALSPEVVPSWLRRALDAPGAWQVRSAVIAVAFLGAVALYWLAFVRTARAPFSRRRRSRHRARS